MLGSRNGSSADFDVTAHLARAGATQRVAEGDGATLGVDFRHVDAQLLDTVDSLATRRSRRMSKLGKKESFRSQTFGSKLVS